MILASRTPKSVPTDAIAAANRDGRLKVDHLIHLRCEVSSSDVLDHFSDFEEDPQVRLVSLMDHAPGQRQFQTMDQYTLYYKTKRGLSDAAFAEFVERRVAASDRYAKRHRDSIAAVCQRRGITIASHDDATLDHVDEAIGYGIKLAEFPTSLDAARASHEAGMSVLMGAPNIVRGKSHSGNISARDLARLGLLDVLSSDYVPLSLVHAPFLLADEEHGISLPQYNVLRILRGAGPDGLCRNEIRDRLIARMPDVTRMLDRMEAMDLVRRERSTEDRRQMTTYLTDVGRTLLMSLDAPVSAEHNRQLQHLSDAQLRVLIDLTTMARQTTSDLERQNNK